MKKKENEEMEDRILKNRIIRDILKNVVTAREWNRKRTLEKKEQTNDRLIKGKTAADIGRLFEKEEEDYHKLKIVSNFWNNNYIEYKSNNERNRILPLNKHLSKIEPYLRDVIINLQNSCTWKKQFIFLQFS